MSNKLNTQQIEQLILQAPIGKYIGKHGAKVLATHAECNVALKDKEFLFHQGDLENHFYIICSGQLALVKEGKQGEEPQLLEIKERGDLVGELSFIDDTPHTVSCMGQDNARVICFKADDIRPLIIEEPQFMFDFMRAVIKRVHYSVSKISKQKIALADYIATGGKGRLYMR